MICITTEGEYARIIHILYNVHTILQDTFKKKM